MKKKEREDLLKYVPVAEAIAQIINLIRKIKVSEIFRFMDEKGVFLIKGAIKKVAEPLQVSKVTIYSYLDKFVVGKAKRKR